MDDDPPYQVSITRADGVAPTQTEGVHRAVVATLGRHRIRSAQISVALVDDDLMARLNATYRGHDGPTDVLAFDLRNHISATNDRFSIGGAPNADGSPKGDEVDGEIVLSVDTAAREASRHGHAVEDELSLYAVHGTLHLLGHDDGERAEADAMHELEDEILTAIGIGPVYHAKRR